MKILFATDGSDAAQKALVALLDRLPWFGAKVELVMLNVHNAVPYAGAAQWVGKDVLERYYDEESEAALAPARATLAAKRVSCETIKRVGDPATEIVRCARESGCDVIALGAQGHTALHDLVLGSVAHKVLARSPLPVLVLR
jgi:nucleotide-binding universal stress UspA family protein